jgi:alpha-L-rhamnosidase
MNNLPPAIARASWIWAPESHPDQYLCFRRTFTLAAADREAFLDISADSDFVAYLNGVEVARGQFSDFTGSKTWDRFPVGPLTRAGTNVLAVAVFYRGEHFSDYQAGPAGLLARLEAGGAEVVTDAQWRVAPHAAFHGGRRERVTPQMGFTFEYDARKEEEWQEPAFDDAGWGAASVVQAGGLGPLWRELAIRPLPPLLIGDLLPVRTATQGRFLRPERKASPAEAMAASALIHEFPWEAFANPEVKAAFAAPVEQGADRIEEYVGAPPNAGSLLGETGETLLELRPLPSGADGRYLVLDLGAEEVGLLEFAVEASAGAVLEIAYGEHLDDGRVRAFVGPRHFADRYICREGTQWFQMPFRRLGGRYLEIHASHYTALKIRFLTLRRVEYPTERLGSFAVADRFSTRLHEVSLRTLELGRHEHYEDCPWREQSLYAYDARLQALYGYYAFGDYRFPEVSLDLLGRSIDASGFVALTAPGEVPVNIPVYTFSWIVAAAEHGLFSGDLAVFRAHRAAMEKVLVDAFARRDEATGLHRPPEGVRYWNFYEWVPGLCGVMGRSEAPGVFQAGYNLHLHEAVRAYLALLAQAGESSAEFTAGLGRLGRAIQQNFWDEEAGLYASEWSRGGRKGRHELIQALALHEGITPAADRDRVIAALTSDQLAPISVGSIYYAVRAVLDHSPASRAWIARRLAGIWEPMLFSGATSMWETANGGNDFDFAGSLCHPWTALPVWFHQAVVLGVHPLAPGFRQFSIAVYPAHFPQASGVIPTPHGPIQVTWQRTPEGLSIEATGPAECQPILQSLAEAPVCQASYNGAALADLSAR